MASATRNFRIRSGIAACLGLFFAGLPAAEPLAKTGDPASPAASNFPATTFQLDRKKLAELAVQDRLAMMKQLHLAEPATLPAPADDPARPANTHPAGASLAHWSDGNPDHTIVRSSWGHWTNYDETKADRYSLPDALVAKDGTVIANASEWWEKRRPEILSSFETEVYGRIPRDTPTVTWEVTETDQRALNGTAVRRRLFGHIDNRRYPATSPSIQLELYTPVHATGPVPMIVVLSGGPVSRGAPTPGSPGALEQVIAHGWGYADFNTATVQADSGGGLTQGIIGLMNEGQPRRPADWGALAAWSWALSRTVDYLRTDRLVDASRLGLEGHSRWGKAALLAAALEPRWGLVYASCSGEGGAKLHRHDVGESVDEACGAGEYHWMAGNFLKYGGNWNALPVDQHELIALVAPRPVFITGGTRDQWADPVGEFKACVAAGPVYRLLGRQDLGTTELPAPDTELISGDLGFRLHAGGHSDLPDWPSFLKFADKYFTPARSPTK